MAEDGSRFCASHARGIEGAVLGALMHADPVNAAAVLFEDLSPWNRRRGKKRTPRQL